MATPSKKPELRVPQGEKVYTRAEFARRVGVSTWTLLRYHKEGHFLAFSCDPKGGRGREAIYLESQIESFRNLPTRPEPIANSMLYTVQEAQAVFRMIDEGGTLRRCVIELGVHPQAVEMLAAKYANLDQGVFISKKMVECIDGMRFDGPSPIESAEDIFAILTLARKELDVYEERVDAVEKPACATPSCKSGPAAYCRKCVKATFAEVEKEAFDRGYAAAIAEVRARVDAENAQAQKETGSPAEAKPPAVRANGANGSSGSSGKKPASPPAAR